MNRIEILLKIVTEQYLKLLKFIEFGNYVLYYLVFIHLTLNCKNKTKNCYLDLHTNL